LLNSDLPTINTDKPRYYNTHIKYPQVIFMHQPL